MITTDAFSWDRNTKTLSTFASNLQGIDERFKYPQTMPSSILLISQWTHKEKRVLLTSVEKNWEGELQYCEYAPNDHSFRVIIFND